MSIYKSIVSARAKYNKEHDEKVIAANENLSADAYYPLRTRICMLLSIDPLSDDETLYNSLSTELLNASETIRVRLCEMLELDYCTDKDIDIYHAIAMLYADRDNAFVEINRLRNGISAMIDSIHSADEDGTHYKFWKNGCPSEICLEARELLWPTSLSPIIPSPESADFNLSPFAIAHAAVILDNATPESWEIFESMKNRDLSSHATSGVDEREGKNSEERK